ncbi:NUDIX hydrolase [Candidatus Aerophobetes bacterium]|nr:NUDIX hydrolase [Candidatus Aerophobetes bacterium]
MKKAKYCIRCGGKLEQKEINGKIRLICQKCGYIHYQNPIPTVDIIIEKDEGIVLIKRKNPPYGWALPGGFVDYGESLEEAVEREAKEETNLNIIDARQFHTYSDPKRDPRFHTVTTVFIGKGEGMMKPSDDAEKIKVLKKGEIPSNLAFDHKKILEDYLKKDFEKSR